MISLVGFFFFSVYKTGSSLSSLKENAFIVLFIGNDIASVKKTFACVGD